MSHLASQLEAKRRGTCIGDFERSPGFGEDSRLLIVQLAIPNPNGVTNRNEIVC